MVLAVLLFLFACQPLQLHDDGTGIRVHPAPGSYDSPVILVVENGTDVVLQCGVTEADRCPALPDTEGLLRLEPGERWEVTAVECAELTAACTPLDSTPDAVPLRGWQWSVR